MSVIGVDEVAGRVREALRGVLDAIHRAGGGVVLEEFPGALEPDARPGESIEGARSADRTALIAAADRLAETRERLRREDDAAAP